MDTIRVIIRERMKESSWVRSRIPLRTTVRMVQIEKAVIPKPIGIQDNPDYTWIYTWPAYLNDGLAGYPNESVFYYHFKG